MGKQKDSDVWVFNSNVQVNSQGTLIPPSDRQFVILDDEKILDVPNLTSE